MMESSLNIPFLYKDFYPYRNYVMRPKTFTAFGGVAGESVSEYFGRTGIHLAYNTDYPDEHINWARGGIHLPSGYNFDHNKEFSKVFGSEPASGVSEVVDYPKRFHWSAKQAPGLYGLGIIKTFLATNVYDTSLKNASEINILYDQHSGKGNNLYAVLDQGVIALITDKSVLRDGIGDELGVILADSGFIQGELWLDQYVGCPDLRWRGKSEGSIKTQQNVHVPGLIFPGDDDMYLLSGNSVVSIGTNYRATLRDVVSDIDASSILTATFDPARNEMWINIDGIIYIYSFTVNNWVSQVLDSTIVGLASSKLYDGQRQARIAVTNYYDTPELTRKVDINRNHSLSIWASLRSSNPADRYVDFAATPGELFQSEFTDIFINSVGAPASITVAVDAAFTDPYTVATAGIKDITGSYRVTLGRTTGGKALIGNTLYVRVEFAVSSAAAIGYVKTGYKKVVGS
jgi:hypothetical protein